MKKKNGYIVLIVGIVIGCLTCRGDYDGYEFDSLDAFTDTLEWKPTLRQEDDVTAQAVLDFIASPPLSLQDRLQSDLYIFTSPGNRRRRSLLDYPFDTVHSNCWLCSGLQLNGWLFYNQTSADNYTKQGTNITSYWNLKDTNLIRNLDLEDFINVNIPRVLDLFGILRMQERRAGLLLNAYYVDEQRWNLELKIPFYYYERNFFLTEEEKERLEKSIVFDADKSGSTDDEEMRKQFMSDALGLGDTRLSAGYFFVDADRYALNAGLELTLPTGCSFHNGFLGSYFAKNSQHAPFNFLEIFKLITEGDLKALEEVSVDFIGSVFDKLSANLMQVSMGNSGHLGIAPFFENRLYLNERFAVTTRGALEFFLSAKEKRFYITKKFPQEFIDLEPYTTEQGANPDEAPAKLDFLNKQFIETLIPYVFPTTVRPGFLVKLTSELTGYFGNNWSFGAGYDIWWQDQERLGRIHANSLDAAMVRTEIAVRPGAFQWKFFGTINYTKTDGRWAEWCFITYADGTVFNSGIGKDFTIGFRFSATL